VQSIDGFAEILVLCVAFAQTECCVSVGALFYVVFVAYLHGFLVVYCCFVKIAVNFVDKSNIGKYRGTVKGTFTFFALNNCQAFPICGQAGTEIALEMISGSNIIVYVG